LFSYKTIPNVQQIIDLKGFSVAFIVCIYDSMSDHKHIKNKLIRLSVASNYSAQLTLAIEDKQ